MSKIKVIKALNRKHKIEILFYWESQYGVYNESDDVLLEINSDYVGVDENGYISAWHSINTNDFELIRLPKNYMKELKITINNEQERDDLIKELKGLKFDKPLPKKWEDLESIEGFYINEDSAIISMPKIIYKDSRQRNVYHTVKQALSSRVKSKLSQVMAVYNGNWVSDWSDADQEKHTIERVGSDINVFTRYRKHQFLAFKTSELRDEFLRNFKEDIMIYFEL